MTEEELQEIRQTLKEIRNGQTTLLNTTRKHLELYAQQMEKSDELTRTFLELQKQSQLHQRVAIMFVLVMVFIVAATVFFVNP